MRERTLYETYDKVGNRVKQVKNGVTTNYTYNGLNQLVTESGEETLEYAYDSNGNQISVTGGSADKYYTYTPSGMLASYTSGGDSQINLYNGNGQRIKKTEGTAVTNYFYQSGSVLYTNDNSGKLKSFNLLNISDAFATSRVLEDSENYYFYTEDYRGSTVNMLDKSGSQVVSYWYTDFGEVIETKAAGYSDFENEIQYTGGIYDELTGLMYLNARFYDPSTGRFITQHTYRGERDDADTWHLYVYCANNPVNFVDLSGHLAERIIGAFVGAMIGGTIELASQGIDFLIKNNMKTEKMKMFKPKWSRILNEMAWGTVSGLMLTTHFKKNIQAIVAGASNFL